MAARGPAGRPDAVARLPARRLFPFGFARRVARERLGLEADLIDTGHLPALSRPAELIERLEAYRLSVPT